jgi:hypothetical protein
MMSIDMKKAEGKEASSSDYDEWKKLRQELQIG